MTGLMRVGGGAGARQGRGPPIVRIAGAAGGSVCDVLSVFGDLGPFVLNRISIMLKG